MKKLAKILYFVNGPAPTAEDFTIAYDIRANVVFRNATAVSDCESLEICHGVAGNVPEIYKHLPTAEEAIEAFDKGIAAKVKGDKAPPELPKQNKGSDNKGENQKPAWGAK